MEQRRADLVLEGGGVKAIAHVGAVAEFAAQGHVFERVAGSSAGAIVAAFVAAGIPVERLVTLLRELDYRRFADRSVLDRVPVVCPTASVWFDDGYYEGEALQEFVGEVLADAGVETFGALRRDDRGSGLPQAHQYSLVVTVVDLSLGQLVRLPWDYQRLYGLDPDRQSVAQAVHASAALPFVYEPVRLPRADGGTSTVVDGGVLSNYPIDTFDRRDLKPPRWPTFGVKLTDSRPLDQRPPLLPLIGRLPPVHLLEQLLTTLVVGHDRARLSLPHVRARTVEVDTSEVSILDFDLSAAQREGLYVAGREATRRFLESWDFDAYVRRFAGGGSVDA